MDNDQSVRRPFGSPVLPQCLRNHLPSLMSLENEPETEMATTTLESISTELELVEGKKTNLKKAFEELQTHANFLSSSSVFANLKWEDIDSYFTSFHSSLVQKFSLLQSQNKPTLNEKPKNNLDSPRPELKSFCEKMDGLGLRKYILEHPNRRERSAIRVELADVWKHAPDPAALVLSAMQGFFRDASGLGWSAELDKVRTVCVLLLEEFMKARMDIGKEVKEKARALAAEWKRKMEVASGSSGDTDTRDSEQERLGKLGFLHLLAAFRLVENSEFDMNELIEYAVGIAGYRQAVELCRFLGFGERISEVVHKLIGKGKQLLAVKFIFQFELTDKFPPLPLLEAYILDSKEAAQKVYKNGKSSRQALNEAAAKEIGSLNSLIKIIEDWKLESKYPMDVLLKRVKELEKMKTIGKRAAAGPALKGQQPAKKLKRFRRYHSRRNGAAGPSAIHEKVAVSAAAAPLPKHYVQTTGLLTNPYAAYGLPGSGPAAIPYEGASAGMYGLSGPPSGNLDTSSLYPSESQMQPTYYDRSFVYGAPSLPPQYHLAYHPN